MAFRSHRTLRLEAGSPLVVHGAVHKACSCVVLSASPDPSPRFLGRSLRVTDLVLAGAEARMDLVVPTAAIVFILVVPSSELIPRRALRICDSADAPGLTRYIKAQSRSDSGGAPATHLREAVAASQVFPVASARLSAVMAACRLIE